MLMSSHVAGSGYGVLLQRWPSGMGRKRRTDRAQWQLHERMFSSHRSTFRLFKPKITRVGGRYGALTSRK